MTEAQTERGRRVGKAYGGWNLGYRSPHLAPTECATIPDILWAAGIFEGEGNCSRTGTRGGDRVSVNQRGDWLPRRLRSLFGGSVRNENRPAQPDLYVWTLTGARARGFLMSIYGLLSPRRQGQVRKMLQVGEFK